MSAVIAVFNRHGAPVESSLLQAMINARPERGPDGHAVAVLGCVGLAHQHFWLTAEQWGEEQPLSTKERVVSCDARLDNREALSRLLDLNREQVRTITDAALISLSYARWGINCLRYLRGDFVFAVWDEAKKELFLARDALGARDICYFANREWFIAASEVSQVLAHPQVEARINENKVAARLQDLWDRQEETFYENISFLPPAHGLVVTRTALRMWRYWDIDPGRRIRYQDSAAYGQHYRDLLSAAVANRLRTVGPVGISLSGGLDSTSVAALAAPLVVAQVPDQDRLASFSYAFDTLRSCDERAYIRATVEKYDLDAHYLPCDDKWALKDLPTWPSTRAAVLADPYILLPLTVMAAAQEKGIRLLLAGYYGDTLFSGGRYWALDLMREMRWGLLLKIVADHYRMVDWRQAMFEDGLRQLIPPRAARAYRRWRPRKPQLSRVGIHADLLAKTDLLQRLAVQNQGADFSQPGLGHRYRTLTLSVFSQGLAASRYQYNQHGLELAIPYYDRELVEFVMAIPAHELGRPDEERRAARQAMKPLLPQVVLKRPDHTSFLPLRNKGLWEKERAAVIELLADPLIVQRKYIDPNWLRSLKLNSSDSPQDTYMLWKALSLEIWLRRYWQ